MEGTEAKPKHLKKHEEPVVPAPPVDPVVELFKRYRNQMTYGSQKGDLDVAAAILTLASIVWKRG